MSTFSLHHPASKIEMMGARAKANQAVHCISIASMDYHMQDHHMLNWKCCIQLRQRETPLGCRRLLPSKVDDTPGASISLQEFRLRELEPASLPLGPADPTAHSNCLLVRLSTQNPVSQAWQAQMAALDVQVNMDTIASRFHGNWCACRLSFVTHACFVVELRMLTQTLSFISPFTQRPCSLLHTKCRRAWLAMISCCSPSEVFNLPLVRLCDAEDGTVA